MSYMKVFSCVHGSLILAVILVCLDIVLAGRVRVKIYDHRAEHDPNELYGKGPWKYKGYGYGIEYQYEPDGSYQRERGYGFIKAYGRDFCKYKSHRCRPADKQFFKAMLNPGEPYWGHPSGDVIRDHQEFRSSSETSFVPQWVRHQ